MLELQKLVLKNVCNNSRLFKKELRKSLAWLNSAELTKLRIWLRENYWDTRKAEIMEVMYPASDKIIVEKENSKNVY